MRFLRLDLIAFGPFTQTTLDFSGRGLHLIYGPNEAGKTSARHALRTALFGFRHRVEFDFLHDKSALRVGLVFEGSDGTRTAFIRRRGTKNDLLDIDNGSPLASDPVAPLLARMGLAGDNREAHFERAFAIGEAELRQGGEEIIAGKGDLSELLFMTAAGLPRLRAVERELRSSADALFLPSGKKPPINEALQRWKDLQTEAQQKSLPPAEFLKHSDELKQAKSKRDELEGRLTELRRRQAHLERLRHAVRPAGRLREREQELALVADAPLLPKGFSEERRRIETEQRQVANDLQRLDAEFEQLAAKLDELAVPADLLASAQEIERLYKRLGSYEQTLSDIPKRTAERNQFESVARATLRDIRPDLELDNIESLRLTRQQRASITELAGERRDCEATQRQIADRRRKLADEISRTSDELERLGSPPASERLKTICGELGRHRELDSTLAEARAELARLQRHVASAVSALAPWQGRVEELEQLAVPSNATIERFENDFREITGEAKRLAERRAETERALLNVEQALSRLSQEGEVPTEESLHAARERRDDLWQQIRDSFVSDEAPRLARSQAEVAASRFESASHSADDAADRLRREANRTQQLVSLTQDKQRLLHAKEEITSTETALASRKQQLESEWCACWPFLQQAPRTPREMRDWRASWEHLLRLLEQQRSIELRATSLATQQDSLRNELCTALGEATCSDADGTAPLATLIRRAEQWLARCDEDSKRRSQLQTIIDRAQKDLDEIDSAAAGDDAERDRIECAWSERMTALGLPPDASAKVAEDFLAATDTIFDQLDKAAAHRDRLAQMEQHRGAFEADLQETITRLAHDLAELSPERAATALRDRLVEAQLLRDRRQTLCDRRETIDEERGALQRRSAEIETALALLCRDAGCATIAELPRIEERAERRRTLEEQVSEVKDELRAQSGGLSIEQFLAEIDAIDVDAIGPELQRLDHEIATLDNDRQQAAADIGRHEQALSAMKGDAAAADTLEDAEGVLARLAADVERYVRLRLAARLLREGRERYRKKTGNEVLDCASRLFSELTCGAFEGLRVDFGENDEPALFGVRSSSGALVRPDGMSDGTADQLYLALRLAGLHAWLDKHEAVPFIVDDLLIHFDDRRAAAALRILADLAERTQVLFFTHHEHLRELAREVIPPSNLHLHDLTTLSATHSSNGQPAGTIAADSGPERSRGKQRV